MPLRRSHPQRRAAFKSMKFHLGAIPETPEHLPDSSWTPLREPSPWALQFLALPLGIVASIGVGFLWFSLTPLGNLSPDSLGMVLVAFVAIIPVHELIQAAARHLHGAAVRLRDCGPFIHSSCLRFHIERVLCMWRHVWCRIVAVPGSDRCDSSQSGVEDILEDT